MLTPQLATPSSTVPSGDGWIYEIKFDGYRILARIEGGNAKLVSRNGRDWSAKFPAVVDALRRLNVENAWIDGEVVAINGEGYSDFGKLQRSLENPGESVVSYSIFDLPFLNGEDLRALPLMERKTRLKELFRTPNGECSYSRIRFKETPPRCWRKRAAVGWKVSSQSAPTRVMRVAVRGPGGQAEMPAAGRVRDRRLHAAARVSRRSWRASARGL